MEESWHQLTNSVTLIFIVQTCITCSRPTSSVVQEMPLWPVPPLLLFSWCFSPQLFSLFCLMAMSSCRGSALTQVTDCHLTQPHAVWSQADPPLASSSVFLADEQASNA